jgi:sterol desaturase/sphingolipid hydroxylase (fatty acid hydroxylase superfamily)
MNNFLGYSDGAIRLAVFVGVLLLMALLEILWPKRKLDVTKSGRWVTNLGIGVLGALLLRLMAMLAVPIAAVAAAFYAEAHGIGLLNQVDLPGWLKLVIALLVLDLAIWAQHLASHKVSVFWRLHQVHHADRDIDVTTAIRFHPIEIGLSMLWKIVVVLAIGASPFAVFLFEVILNACAMFNHANIAMPRWLDAFLRLFVVTPDMHRVHHSVLRREHDSNYGFNLSVWDRLFGTYTAQPHGGHQGMTIGLPPHQNLNPTRFDWSLLLPFRPLQLSRKSSSGSSGGKAPRSDRKRAPARGRSPKSR